MPRIAAASIEEHVRQQTQRIHTAARKLFAEQGFLSTDLGDIAREVGLARNSLYRYFPSKDELLLKLIEADMAPHLERLATLADDFPEPVDRIAAVVNFQFDLATGPEHATLELMREVKEGSRELRERIGRLHSAPNEIVAAALRDAGAEPAASETAAAIIGGMVYRGNQSRTAPACRPARVCKRGIVAGNSGSCSSGSC